MSSKTWEGIGAERGAETGRVYPEQLTIVGLDASEEHLLKQYPTESRVDQNARAAIMACRDTTRLEKPPEWWVRALAHGSPPAVECFRLPPDKKGKVWVLVYFGRHRTAGQRELNSRCKKKAERQTVDIKLLPLRPEKLSRAQAVIAQAGSNNYIPESLQTRAARALEMQELRVDGEVMIDLLAQGGGQEVVDDLLKWAKVFPYLGEEAVRLANAGKLRLGRARRLAKLRPEDQGAALLQPKPRRVVSGAPHPISPARLRALLAEVEADSKISGAIRTLLQVLSGEASPEDLTENLYAAWNRAGERVSKRSPQTAASADLGGGAGED